MRLPPAILPRLFLCLNDGPARAAAARTCWLIYTATSSRRAARKASGGAATSKGFDKQ